MERLEAESDVACVEFLSGNSSGRIEENNEKPDPG
jgi:hypothetical protein